MRATLPRIEADRADHDAVVARFRLAGRECRVVRAPGERDGAGLEAIGALTVEGRRYSVLVDDAAPAAAACPDPLEALTPRELEIALLVARGEEAKAIARSLRISFHTVRVHVCRIYAKLGLHKQTELAACIAARLATAPARAE
jgi:DNA-binding NarL/FixJ family response regulator